MESVLILKGAQEWEEVVNMFKGYKISVSRKELEIHYTMWVTKVNSS